MKKIILNWLFNKALKVIALNIVKYNNPLTPEYLLSRDWIESDGYYYEPFMKERDIIFIRFEKNYYSVYHSSKKTFIALESSVEWFENYYLLNNAWNLYELAGV